MEEKQFELSGVTFGLGAPVEITDWTPGGPDIAATDVARATGHGMRLGRPRKQGTTWGFSLFTNGLDENDGWARLAALAGAWELPEDVDVVPLRYRVAGKLRRVYGQPRRFTPVVDNTSLSGRINIEADFAVTYPLYFDDRENTVPFSLVAPLDTTAGFAMPMPMPGQSAAGAGQRQGSVRIGGTAKTPLRVTVRAGSGPLNDVRVQVGDAVVELEDPVDPRDPVVMDARPWVSAITTQSGGLVATSPRGARVSALWVPPGDNAVVFTADDPTGTGSVEVSWHDAYRTPR